MIQIFKDAVNTGNVYVKDNGVVEVIFSGWEFVNALATDKHKLIKELEPVVSEYVGFCVTGDSIDQLNPELPLVSAMFVKQDKELPTQLPIQVAGFCCQQGYGVLVEAHRGMG